ncbi:hypothetical protein AN958_06824 [Leucoagaricus sp. SymC.cos]|nr:hypothetical protein AN958_06824 [Leucoagaricus sp. SymC.cos]
MMDPPTSHMHTTTFSDHYVHTSLCEEDCFGIDSPKHSAYGSSPLAIGSVPISSTGESDTQVIKSPSAPLIRALGDILHFSPLKTLQVSEGQRMGLPTPSQSSSDSRFSLPLHHKACYGPINNFIGVLNSETLHCHSPIATDVAHAKDNRRPSSSRLVSQIPVPPLYLDGTTRLTKPQSLEDRVKRVIRKVQGRPINRGNLSGAHSFVIKNSTIVNASGENAQPQNGEFEVLHWLTDHIIKGAELNSSERDPPPRCRPGTRTSILGRTRRWFEDPQREKKLLWIRGPAGVGKSAIVQTFAESVLETQQLGACLFFSRPNGRTNPQRVFPTLAYQFAIRIKSYRSYLTKVMRKDPHSLGKAVCEQFRILVAEPFARHKLGNHLGEFLVAIDGPDECGGDPATENSAQCLHGCRTSEQVHREIVRLIRDFVRKNPTVPPVRIIASRPETHIQAVFSEVNEKISCMEEDIPVDSDEACRDVEKFLHASFVEIYYQFPDMIIELPWPGDRDFLQIARAAGGLFVFAQVVVRFIEDPRVGNTISQL